MTTPPTDEVVHEPDPEFVASTNVAQFMDDYGIADYEELIARCGRGLADEPDSGVEWFWDELVEYLGIEFGEPYDAVRDSSENTATSGSKTTICRVSDCWDRPASRGTQSPGSGSTSRSAARRLRLSTSPGALRSVAVS